MSRNRGKSATVSIDIAALATITDQLKNEITKVLNAQMTQQILSCVQQVLPTAVQQAINQNLPRILEVSMQNVVEPLKMEITSMQKRIQALEVTRSNATPGDTDVHQRVAKIEKTISTIQSKSAPVSFNSEFIRRPTVSSTHARYGSATGAGDDIGISKNYHLVLKKIPDTPGYDETWLRTYLTTKLPKTATVMDIEKLKSANEERAKRTISQTFKLVIQYAGDASDLYSPELYPRNAEVKRYRFLRKK